MIPQISTIPQKQILKIVKRKKDQRTQNHDYKNDEQHEEDIHKIMNELKEDANCQTKLGNSTGYERGVQ
jgi:non-homologous end joining protein Ku